MTILFITRKYPPMKGGMEKVAYELYNHLSEIEEVLLIKWGGSNKWLPIVLPVFLIKSVSILSTKKIDTVYLQDGLLSPLGVILKIFRVRTVITIHGLDITYKNKCYQYIIPKCIERLDKVTCISQATKKECIQRAISKEKLIVIPNGIKDELYLPKENKNELKIKISVALNERLEDKKILLTVGRLIERKGIHWFIDNVYPEIVNKNKDIMYVIIGDGIFKKKIQDTIYKNKLDRYIIMLGKVDNEMLRALYNITDVFVMPNIPIKEDMEGFGIVALEAASCRVPIVASDCEGIKDCIKDGMNGILIKPYDTIGFVNAIMKLMKDDNNREEFGKKVRDFTLENNNWRKIADDYFKILI
jgi:glycosyltransferase involved in cell wall biosynthesis